MCYGIILDVVNQRKIFSLLEERRIAFQTRLYLQEVPTVAERQQVLHKFNFSLRAVYKNRRMFKGNSKLRFSFK